MRHERAEQFPGDEGRAYLYETGKGGFGRGPIRSRVTELAPMGGGFHGLTPFAWGVTLATSDSPATARKVEAMHASHRLAALEAVKARREGLAEARALALLLPPRDAAEVAHV